MRISDDTRFPHPVLSVHTNDFTSGDFDVQFEVHEHLHNGALALEHEIRLTESAVQELVVTGRATVGCFVRCGDTYFTGLQRLSWPRGRSDFPPGSLLNRVTLRPLIWLEAELLNWNPGTIHSEFDPPVSFARGDVIGVAPEYVISVGQAKFAPLESIFELQRSEDLPEGRLDVDPESDRILLLAGGELYETINLLRGQVGGQPVLMNSVYLPAVMEVLDALRAGSEQYATYRWYQPFTARCDANAIDISSDHSKLESAQKLLNDPARALAQLVTDGD